MENIKGMEYLVDDKYKSADQETKSASISLAVSELVDDKGQLDRTFSRDNTAQTTLGEELYKDLANVATKFVELQKGEARNNKGQRITPRVDYNFSEFITDYYGMAKLSDKTPHHDTYLRLLGFDPASTNIATLMSSDVLDYNKEYLIPRLIDDAIRTGIRETAPQYNNWISRSQAIASNRMQMPYILEVGNGAPQRLGERQDADIVTIQFEDKEIEVLEIGKALEIGDHTMRLTPINLLTEVTGGISDHFIRAENTMAVDVLLNGDQKDGSWAASSVGTETSGTITYKDLFKNYAAMREIGRAPDMILTNRDVQHDLLLDPLFWGNNVNTGYQIGNLEARGGSPYPTSQMVDYHGAFPSGGKVLLFTRQRGMYRVVFQPLITERSRSARHKKDIYYMNQATAFIIEMMDSRLLIDSSKTTVQNPLDDMFDYGSYMNVPLQG